VKLSDKINFVYDVEKAVISVYDKGNSIFSGSLSDYRDLLEEKKLISPDYSMQLGQFFNAVEEANGDGLYKMDTSIFSQEGQFLPTIVNFSAIESNSRVAYIVGFWSDGRAMSAVETYASNLANLDPLTNLLNKKAIKDYAQEALAKAKADGSVVTFVLIDLDNFKEINDRFGHMFGDSTIVSVARIMSEAVGSRGVVGRVGGDEFIIVLTGYPDGDPSIRALLKTIRSNVEWYFAQKVKDAKFTCSVVTASYPADTEGYDNLYKLADHCLYIAKVLGRNRYIIYTESLMGSVEEILKNSTVVRMENYVSDAEKYKHLADIIRRINQSTDKTVEMNKIFGELLPLYDINSAHYCLMGDSPRYCGASDKDIPEPYEYIRQYGTYKDLMNETGFLAIGNYVNSKERLPELVEYMLKNEICSLFIVSHKDEKGEAIGLFVFEAVKHFKNWSEFDKRMLVMICSLLEYLL
ncbi:MAG: GGDEF domain-containing protein, partial [Firmicutes bacterium]|nr:GGDEF domain-containing protein [Bacillota bacterium]